MTQVVLYLEIQHQLHECQDLLVKYQHLVTQQKQQVRDEVQADDRVNHLLSLFIQPVENSLDFQLNFPWPGIDVQCVLTLSLRLFRSRCSLI